MRTKGLDASKNNDGKSLNRIRTINLKHEQKRKHETEKEKLKLKLDQNLQDWEKDKRMQRRKIETLEHSLALSNDSKSKLKEDYRRQMAEIESLKVCIFICGCNNLLRGK